jgi:hypothetical protein
VAQVRLLLPLTLSPALALSLALSLGPAGAPASAQAEPAPGRSAASSTRVLAISIDGLNPKAIRKLGKAKAPNFYRLMKQGAFTLNARAMYEITQTLPNHASMMTGRRIDAAKGGHGVDWDAARPGSTVQEAAGHPVESVFDVVHASGGSTALFGAKEKFDLYERSWPDSISRVTIMEDRDRKLVRQARTDLQKQDRAFTFLHIAVPDHAGHDFGFMSAKYVAAVASTDKLLGILLRAIDGDPDLTANLVVLLTADHGGIGARHGDQTKLGNYRVPFLAWGPGVDSGGHLYAMNPSYKDPKKGRPAYGGKQPIRNGDIANLVTDLLGLPAVSGSLCDADQDLTIGTN